MCSISSQKQEEVLIQENDKTLKNELRHLMWNYAGIIREKQTLQTALNRVKEMLGLPIGKLLRLRLLVSQEIITSALKRKTSLGPTRRGALYLFITPLSTSYGLAELAVKASPLALCAVGLALGFRANVWNIGAEGQLVMGAVAGGGVLAPWRERKHLVGLAACSLRRSRWRHGVGRNSSPFRNSLSCLEILVSLMLTYVAELCSCR